MPAKDKRHHLELLRQLARRGMVKDGLMGREKVRLIGAIST